MQMNVRPNLTTALGRLSQGRKPAAFNATEPPADHLSQILSELKHETAQPPAPVLSPEDFAAEQRKAAEELLFEACALEQRVKHEAAAAAATEQHNTATRKLERARFVEREARNLAEDASSAVGLASKALAEAERQLHVAQEVLEGQLASAQEHAAAREAAEKEAADAAAVLAACDAQQQGALDAVKALAARIAERAAAVSASGSNQTAA
jgi:hypothetical protein